MGIGSHAAVLAAGLLLVGARALAAPAHYVVFEMDGDGRVEPVYYTRVDLQPDRSRQPAQAAAALAGDEVEFRVSRGGADLGTRRVEVPLLRGEFARDPERGDGAIVATPAIDAPRSFVVRIGLDEADAIAFGSDPAQAFDLAALAARADALRLPHSAVPKIERVRGSGSPANRVDVLVFGDGYTAAQESTFHADAAILRDAFFGLTPYREYENFVNWTTAFVPSNQSGADHPPYLAGCNSQGCCGDPDMQSDPFAGQFVDTAFNGRFCTSQIHRLVTVSQGLVLAAAAAYPDWDKIVVVVNDPVYGGSGGTLSVTSTHAQANQIVLHEYGHSFTELADEYSSPYPLFPACSDLSGSTPCEANVTNQATASQVKWRSWFAPGNPIPTPPGAPGVGLFEGARYLATGMYRPVDTQCLMQFLGVPFCPVCRQEYVRTLYRGGWGTPAGGIDLVEPGSESPSPASPVAYVPGTTQTFSVTLLEPTIGDLDVQWLLDGVPVDGAHDASFEFSQSGSSPASRTLELRVIDATPFVSAGMAEGLLVHGRSWTIEVDGDVIFRDGFDIGS